jgi:cation diffusion facilitator family transporter
MVSMSKGTKLKTLVISGVAESVFAGIAVLVALPSNSIALWSNASRVSLEAALCIAAIFAMVQANRERDEQYNYGLGKVESLTSLFGGIIMFGSLLVVGGQALTRFSSPPVMEGTGAGLIYLAAALTFNIVLFMRLTLHLRQDFSPILQTQRLLYRNALIASSTALLTVLAGTLFPEIHWIRFVDPVGAIVLSCFIFRTGLYLIRRAVNHLLDGSVEESVQLLITKELVKHFDAYSQLHGVRSRRSGSRMFVEVFLSFSPEETHAETLLRIENLKRDLEDSVAGSEVWIVPVRG